MNWKKTDNFVQTFIDESFEPVLIHVIQSGHIGTFIIVFDDAFQQVTGVSEVHTKESFKNKFGFEIQSKLNEN
jgi:hypothetical protein